MDKAYKRHEEPLMRITARTDMPAGKAWIIRVLAIVFALIVGGLVILSLGHNPFSVYADMLRGSLATRTARIETVKIAVPLLGTALAITPAFKMKFCNIGAEGQIMAGAIAASYFALYWYKVLPGPLLILVMLVAGAVAGGIWGVIPAIFKAKWGVNETLFTLMFNYIIIGFEKYLQNGPWIEKGTTYPKIATFDQAARLPKVLGVHVGWIAVLVLTVVMFFYLKYTKQGYEISVVGGSVRTAQYAGMNVKKVIIRTMIISGVISGIVGFLIVSGANYTLNESTSGGIGFTAISVAWLARLNPFVMIFISAFLAILSKGSNTIQTDFKIPASAAGVLTGIILLCMLGGEFFVNYRLIFRHKKHAELPKGGEEA